MAAIVAGKHRPVMQAGALAATVVAGVAPFLGPQALATARLQTVQREIALVDNWTHNAVGDAAALPAEQTFDSSLYYLLNDMLGVGAKTMPELFSGAGTIGDVLAVSGLDLSTTLGGGAPDSGLMHLLGLDNIKLDDLLPLLGLESTKTFDQILDQLSLGGVTLDFLLTPLGIASTQTTLGLAHRFSVAHLTLGEMLGRAGFSPNDTFGDMYDKFGLSGTALPWLTNLPGSIPFFDATLGYCPDDISVSMTLNEFFGCLTLDATYNSGADNKGHAPPAPIHLNKDTTIEQILTAQHFYDENSNHTSEIIGNWTLGDILSQKNALVTDPFIWNTDTTVQDLIDHIHVNTDVTSGPQGGTPTFIYPFGQGSGSGSGVNEQSPGDDNGGAAVPEGSNSQQLPTLGDTLFGDILKWLNLDPNMSLADILTGRIWIGDHVAGSSTIGDMLNGFIVNPLALGPLGTEVTDSTSIQDLLNGMGWGGPSLNDLLGLTP